ncbi:NitT/TauT family transport system ATP-binding protein [Poseidonocella pacifica]|uniref:NitT/TauT family transport system ATP-binding protein n=1 Tax=Poseidonocella pacifica TaxID=871651 RepID=A0A1I0X3X6_9RHOB|nr:ATP-binding cassette domain-containing protein [Poseidonocella pacifica]SFA95554.1 NitT/TauT family transport system ATP-binding protein [Poseidonocella pacifica]
MSFIQVRDVWQAYGGRSIIERVTLDVSEGEFVSIVGASGCGKSTFLRLLLADERPVRGTITVDGGDVAVEPGRERGVVFQRYSVFPHLTVRENIVAAEGFNTASGWLFGAAKRTSRERADAILARIGLNHVAEQYPASLSGGMQQRLAIGQALTAKPRVLLLDEPFGALDPGTRVQMHDFLTELRAETKMTVFMVSHDLEEAFKLGDRVLVFDKPRWDPQDPGLYGATITYEFDARDGGMPYQHILDRYPSLKPQAEPAPERLLEPA